MTFLHSLDPEHLRNDGFPGRILIAGDTTDLPVIRRLLGALPGGVTGDVFIEAFSDIQHAALPAPEGVGVTWLYRTESMDVEGMRYCSEKGVRLVASLHGWLGEWVLADDDGDYRLWIGARALTRVNRLCAALQAHIDHRAFHSAPHTHEGDHP